MSCPPTVSPPSASFSSVVPRAVTRSQAGDKAVVGAASGAVGAVAGQPTHPQPRVNQPTPDPTAL